MDPVDSYLSLVDTVLTLCSAVYRLAKKVKSNKEHCRNVRKRVKSIRNVVGNIHSREAGIVLMGALVELCKTLTSAKTLMEKFCRANTLMSILKSGSYQDRFFDMDKMLTENFQVLSVALQTEQGKMMRRVHDAVTRGSSHPEAPTPQPNMTSGPTAPPFEATMAPPYPTTTPYPNTVPYTSSFMPPPYPTPAPIPFQGNMANMSLPVSYTMPAMPAMSAMSIPTPIWSSFSSPLITSSAPMTFTTMNGTNLGSTFIIY